MPFSFTRAKWEKICRRCGKCCYEKYYTPEGHVVFTGKPCRWLDRSTNLCRVYSQREQINPRCVRVLPDRIKDLRLLPVDCAYREYLETMHRNSRRLSWRRRRVAARS